MERVQQSATDRSRARFSTPRLQAGVLVRKAWPRSRGAALVAGVFAGGAVVRVLFMVAYRPALLGIPDSGAYVEAAHRNLFLDPVHPAGYALFLRVLHVIDAHLAAAIAVQHLLGLLTAVVLFTAVRHATTNSVAGLIPAGAVMFNGLQLSVEHSPLSDPLFVLLVALVLLVAIRASDGRPWTLVALGVLVGASVMVRSVALVLIPLISIWLLLVARGGRVERGARAIVPLLIALALVGAYVVVQGSRTGVEGLTQADGRFTYAVAAQFADCSKFSPPPGTRALCQTSPPARRGSMNQYLEGYPDRGPGVPPGGRGVLSPAWRVYGPIPNGNDELGAFGREAILHQPLDYLAVVARNFSYFWRGSPRPFISAALAPNPGVETSVTSYYATGSRVSKVGFRAFRGYVRAIELGGASILLLLFLSLTAVAVRDAKARAIALLCAAAGWLLLLGAAAVHTDPRYALPALGPLAAAASIAVSDRGPGCARWLRQRV